MSTLREFHALEKDLQTQLERLAAIKSSEQFFKEVEFEKKLLSLMNRYSMNKGDVEELLDSSGQTAAISVHEKRSRYGGVVKKSGEARKQAGKPGA